VRWRFPFGGVPLANLALGQVSGPLASVVRVGGAVTLCGLTVVGGQLLSTMFGWWRGCWRDTVRPAGFAAATLIGAVLIAALAPAGSAMSSGDVKAPSIRIAIVQGGGPQGTRAVDGGRDEEIAVFNRHLEASRTIAPGSVDLIVWPENTVNADGKFGGSPEEAQLRQLADDLETPISVGMVEDVDRKPSDSVNRFTNAQVIITPTFSATGACINDVTAPDDAPGAAESPGAVGAARASTPAAGSVPCARYDKVHRVPFGEYMPMRSILEALGAPTNLVPKDAVSGRSPAVTDLATSRLGTVRLGVVISWEVFFADRGRDAIGNGGAVMLNPTNGSSYTGTVLQTQQVASSKLRALETGRWVVQAAPTGFSAFISPGADVLQRTGISERKVVVRDVPLRSGSTWYVSLGDHPWGIMALVIVAVAVVMAKRDERLLAPAAIDPDLDATSVDTSASAGVR
ncbi:MAG: apolipoprotein N-acyltransferase, partial [Acidimicrobiia bacterium]